MKKQKEWVVVMVVVLSFSIGILFSGVSTLYAAEKSSVAQQINIKQLQEKRMPSMIPLHRTRTVDLRCGIKAFYDQARTKPISGGHYDWGLKIYPSYIYYDITVENTAYSSEHGTKADKSLFARTFNVRIVFTRPHIPYDPLHQGPIYETFTGTVINLGPGGSHVYSYYGGPPQKAQQIPDYRSVVVTVDPEDKVKEESETNNKCSYTVTPK